MQLSYDHSKWEQLVSEPDSTLQLFITNRCNKRCAACFYDSYLSSKDMSFDQYKIYIDTYGENTGKVILIGGEPTLHPNIADMILYNRDKGLRTTVYTNGTKLGALSSVMAPDVKVRVGVLGIDQSEKKLSEITPPDYPVTVVFMLRQDNVQDLYPLATAVIERGFQCEDLYISSIRDIALTKCFWLDTPETFSLSPAIPGSYPNIIQGYLEYMTNEGPDEIKRLHLCRRGVIDSDSNIGHCRYLNIFPNGEKTICPWDISLHETVNDYKYWTRKCNKNKTCILQKIVLQRK